MEDVELSDLVKQVTDTSDNAVSIRLIEQFFLRRLYTLPEYNRKRMSAVFHEINLLPQINIAHLSETACLSSKQFGRIFADYVGTTPKEFIRIVRMQRALSMLQQDATIPFVQVAYECGFSDQSHMIKDFKLYSGYTPAEYLSVCAPISDYFSELLSCPFFPIRLPRVALLLQCLCKGLVVTIKKKRNEKTNCIF